MVEVAKTEGDWQVRAVAWELLALSFRYPESGLAEVVASGEWADAADEVAAALDAEALLHALRAEATHLFVGAPDPVVSPYEGVWRAADDGVQALLFVNPHSMEVERFCKACGLGRPEGTNEPLDHVATECELLEYLALLAGGLAAPAEGAPAPEALPGGSPAAAYDEFLRDHALTWMPRFAEKTASEARLPFYRAGAHLLAAIAGAQA